MNETIREMDSAFFITPEYRDIFKYHKEYSDEGSMYADGVFFDEFGYYKFFEVEYLDTKGFLPMAINVDFDAQVYATTVKGARINISLTKAIDLATKAYGMDFDNLDDIIKFIRDTAGENVINYVAGEVMPAYIDEEGKQVFYDRVMTHIYACLVDRFAKQTPIDCKYEYEQLVRPTGTGILVDWDNNNIISSMTAMYADKDNSLYSYYSNLTYEQLNQALNELKTNNPAVQALFDDSDVVSIYYDGRYSPNDDIRISIWGYDINNNTVSVGNDSDGQFYAMGSGVSKVGGFLYNLTSGEITQTTPPNRNVFYNYPHVYTYTRYIGRVVDSLGFTGEIKPYEVTGTPPSTRPISENYPNYPKSGNDYPVGEPDPDEPTDQDYIWRGVPEPKPPIPPVIGLPPGRRPDVDGDETLPDVGAVEGVYGLFTVYKASINDLLNLGSFLWQDDTLTSLLNIFKNDPMQAIISLHQLYFNPSAPNTRALKLGTVQVKKTDGTDMWLNFINDRYQRLACGFVKINRYFNDIRDYQTKISIYLPFIGIRELDINEMLDATVFTDYYVDTYTGDCVATISITRDNSTTKKVLAMYNGNCASPLPLTGADKSRLFANLGSIGAGIVSTVMTGGAGAGALIGSAINARTSHNISIEKSGSMGGNWGAMGYKKPYFIIERPQTYDAVQKAKIIGFGANLTTSLAQMRGFVRVSAVHVDNIPGATDIEKARIEQLLKEGIFL